jgi:hypothetical protein
MINLLGVVAHGSIRGLGMRLIENVGRAMERALLDRAFTPDPVLSFVVDDALSADVRAWLSIAVNVGALVPVDTDSSSPLAEIRGERLRLAYLLAPRFSLPLRVGRSVPLSSLLSAHPPAGEEPMNPQLLLGSDHVPPRHTDASSL